MLEEKIGKNEERDMEKLGTPERENTIATLGDRRWPQSAKQERGKSSYSFLSNLWKQVDERPTVGGVCTRRLNGVPSRKGWVVYGQMTQAGNKMSTPFGLNALHRAC